MADPGGGRLDPKSWPGTESDGKETSVHRDQVKQIIKAMQDDLDRYANAKSGRPDDLQGGGRGAAFLQDPKVIGGGQTPDTGYPAGYLLHTYLQNATTHIPQAYSQFLTAYQNLINSLGRQTGVYNDAETTNTGNVGGATTGNTSYYG